MMKKTILIALSVAAAAFAQPGITSTTLSAAVTSVCPNTISLTSITGVSAQTNLLIDDEFFVVLATPTSATSVRVLCGQNGSVPSKHGNGQTVYIGAGAAFNNYGGIYPNGSVQRRTLFGLSNPVVVASTVSTATSYTIKVGELKGGIILQDPSGGAVTSTLPTAALLLAATPGAMVGTSYYFDIRNTADAAETITVAAGTGGTTSGTMTIAQNNGKRFLLRFTNVTPGSEAYTVYSMGTYTF